MLINQYSLTKKDNQERGGHKRLERLLKIKTQLPEQTEGLERVLESIG
jgi:hypothetical protein